MEQAREAQTFRCGAHRVHLQGSLWSDLFCTTDARPGAQGARPPVAERREGRKKERREWRGGKGKRKKGKGKKRKRGGKGEGGGDKGGREEERKEGEGMSITMDPEVTFLEVIIFFISYSIPSCSRFTIIIS